VSLFDVETIIKWDDAGSGDLLQREEKRWVKWFIYLIRNQDESL